MAAAKYNLVIDQGSDFIRTLDVAEDDGTATNLTGYSARAQIRKSKSSESVSASFTCTIPSPTAGRIVMELAAATSAALNSGRYYYDLEIFTSGDANVTRLLQGEITLTQEVTR